MKKKTENTKHTKNTDKHYQTTNSKMFKMHAKICPNMTAPHQNEADRWKIGALSSKISCDLNLQRFV